jgi:N-acetyl-anhydromuramyl-L-alanine amidase AmpD
MLDTLFPLVLDSTQNKEIGRRGQKVKAFIIHRTEGSFKGSLEWCKNTDAQVSYHYIINETGEVHELVDPENIAWHAGLMKNPQEVAKYLGPNANICSIGIALSGFSKDSPTIEQITACAILVRELAKKYKIKLDTNTILPHNAIRSDKICPGAKVSLGAILYLSNLN